MRNTKVKELMITVDRYPTVPKDVSVLQAMKILEEWLANLPPELPPYRAVLVVDESGAIIGKVGHLAFLKAMEPKLKIGRDSNSNSLEKANLSPDILESIERNVHMWDDDYFDICAAVNNTKITEIMHPTDECVDEEMPVIYALHQIIELKSISLLVKRGETIVGIIRLIDIYNDLKKRVLTDCKMNKNNNNKK